MYSIHLRIARVSILQINARLIVLVSQDHKCYDFHIQLSCQKSIREQGVVLCDFWNFMVCDDILEFLESVTNCLKRLDMLIPETQNCQHSSVQFGTRTKSLKEL